MGLLDGPDGSVTVSDVVAGGAAEELGVYVGCSILEAGGERGEACRTSVGVTRLLQLAPHAPRAVTFCPPKESSDEGGSPEHVSTDLASSPDLSSSRSPEYEGGASPPERGFAENEPVDFRGRRGPA